MAIIIVTVCLFVPYVCIFYGYPLEMYAKMRFKGGTLILAEALIKDYALHNERYQIHDDEILRDGETRLCFISFKQYWTFFKWYGSYRGLD